MKKITTVFVFTLIVATAAWSFAQPGATTRSQDDPQAKEVREDPRLPNVLLVGDSISLAYTPVVRELLRGKANVWHTPANDGSSDTVAPALAIRVAAAGKKWAVIHFNYGIWDVVRYHVTDKATGKPAIVLGTTPEQYEKNLRLAAKLLKATGAKVIFATTTPVSPQADKESVPERNDLARKVMQDSAIAVDDLYSAILPRQTELQMTDGVHYIPAGSELLAKSVVASIEAQLADKEPPATQKAEQTNPK